MTFRRTGWLMVVALCFAFHKCLNAQTLTVIPDVKATLASGADLWGDLAIRQPGGPSYAFFAPLLPPLRYVNTRERHYPICLSAPFAPMKSRYVGNGAGVNLAPGIKPEYWTSFPLGVAILVGDDAVHYGQDLPNLDGPHFEAGYLPIVQNLFHHGEATIAQEAFVPVAQPFADHAAVFIRLSSDDAKQPVPVKLALEPTAEITFRDGKILGTDGQALAWLGDGWTWDAAKKTLASTVAPKQPRYAAIISQPIDASALIALDAAKYQSLREGCITDWNKRLDAFANIDVPEPIVNNAWKSLVVAQLMMAAGDEMRYSSANVYARMYEAESGDALRSLMLFGMLDDTKRMVNPLLAYTQPGLRYHDAAFKLQLLAHVYWITLDAEFIRSRTAQWRPIVDLILNEREKENGLLPKENYCGDIATQVYSLNSNASSWRALRDMAAVLRDIGEPAQADAIAVEAKAFHAAIMSALDKSQRTDVVPPFVPVALFGAEQPYERLTDTMVGSYWNLIVPYILGSGVLDAQRQGWAIDTLQQRGGLAMGMIRFHQHSGLYANENGVDDLYTQRYVQALLKRDDATRGDVDRALVSFYGKLAHGMTRDTFVDGEGSSLVALDPHGRPMYLPPNASGNAFFLTTLRELLVQDVDSDDDGTPDTLRLLHATPRAWLEDGKTIRLERLPTAFGAVSMMVKSALSKGKITIDLTPPERGVKTMKLRLRLPAGWKLASAKVSDRSVAVAEVGTMDVSHLRTRSHIDVDVARAD